MGASLDQEIPSGPALPPTREELRGEQRHAQRHVSWGGSYFFEKAFIDAVERWKFRAVGKRYIGEVEAKFSLP